MAALGPVFVKLGQTLASRADLVGDEAAEALKVGRCSLPVSKSVLKARLVPALETEM